MSVRRLTLRQLNRPGQVVSIYRTFYPPGHCYPQHDHDFPELFVIESGHGEQRVGKTVTPMVAGDIGFVAANCAHELRADHARAMVLVNIAFAQDILDRVHALVPPAVWPWRPRAAPIQALEEVHQTFIASWIETLGHEQAGEIDLAAFLLELVRRLRPPVHVLGQHAPPWLREALAHCKEPHQLQIGVAELVRLSGKSAAYLSRQVRRHFSCTTIQLINRQRLRWLARQLRLTRRPIGEVAAECGLANLSHCYRLFAATYGCTPHHYRRQAQGGIVADEVTD